MSCYAILVFSSRHLNRGPGRDETETLHYYNKCLKPLIPALSVSEEGVDKGIIAAAAIFH